MGEFIVIDIREEEAAPEQNEATDPKRRTVVLGKVDDNGVQICIITRCIFDEICPISGN